MGSAIGPSGRCDFPIKLQNQFHYQIVQQYVLQFQAAIYVNLSLHIKTTVGGFYIMHWCLCKTDGHQTRFRGEWYINVNRFPDSIAQLYECLPSPYLFRMTTDKHLG